MYVNTGEFIHVFLMIYFKVKKDSYQKIQESTFFFPFEAVHPEKL